MTSQAPDKFKAANAFWAGLGKIGLTPAAVLRQARLPVTLYDGEKNFVTTAQFFALWRAVGELSHDTAAGLKIATQIDTGVLPPSSLAAYYARDYRDALTRMARFKQLCSPEEMRITESKDGCVIELVWLHAVEQEPPLLLDAAFASFVELGRRGAQKPVQPKRVELKQAPEPTGVLKIPCATSRVGHRLRMLIRNHRIQGDAEMNTFEKKVAVVTGASSGIGRETVLSLIKAGYQVHAGARRL